MWQCLRVETISYLFQSMKYLTHKDATDNLGTVNVFVPTKTEKWLGMGVVYTKSFRDSSIFVSNNRILGVKLTTHLHLVPRSKNE
jgi:hypothetical protein